MKKLLSEAQFTDYRKSEYLKGLEAEINRAEIVASKDIPRDVITTNSTICIEDMDTKEEEVYTLMFPEDADIKKGKISILALIGTAMLGYEVGDTCEWEVPADKRRLGVKKILYQPESSGDYDL